MEKKLKIAEFAALVGTSQKTVYSRLTNADNLPVNEQLTSVIEKVRGRETTFIVTSDEQIQLYQTIFNHLPVNEGNYEDNLTYNNPSQNLNYVKQTSINQSSAIFDGTVINQILSDNRELNNRYEQQIEEYIKVNNQLAELKSTQKLLEDKAGREGLYINEINGLEKDNNQLRTVNIGLQKDIEVVSNYNEKLKTSNKWLLTGLITFFIVSIICIGSIVGMVAFYNILKGNEQVNNVQELVINDKKPAKVQEVVKPQAPQQAKNVNVQHKRK